MQKHNGVNGKKILVVDDVEINQQLAFHIMESWGCSVDIASDGLAGLEKLQQAAYDLVLMDLQMPLMDGMEATRRIRGMNDRCKSTVPVVALTANPGKEVYQHCVEAGMDDCLSKPFTERELLAVVQKNLGKKRPGGPVAEEGCTEKQAAQSVPESGLQEPLYDLSLIAAISGGDPTFVGKMLQLFLETVPATLTGLSTAVEDGSWQAAGKLAHKLKSTIDSMGIASLKETIRRIEKEAPQAGNPEAIIQMTREVVDMMHAVMARVKEDHGL